MKVTRSPLSAARQRGPYAKNDMLYRITMVHSFQSYEELDSSAEMPYYHVVP